MKKLIQILFWFFFLIFITSTYAASAPQELRTLEVSDTTMLVDWEDVEGAIGYYIYYGTQSGSGSTYETEGIDLIDESEVLIEWLLPQTQYFVAVTSVDDFATESWFSPELEHPTLIAWSEIEAVNFRIKSVEVVDSTTLEFLFSTDLDASPSAVREFIVEEKISATEIVVDISDVDSTNPKNAIVLLGSELVPATEYKVTVLDIRDSNWNSIESGVDAFISFMTPAVMWEADPKEETPPEEETVEETEETDLNAAWNETEIVSVESDNSWNAGVTLNSSDTSNNTTVAAEENTTLPQTWPEHVLLLLIALMLSWGIYFYSIKRKA